MDSSIAGERIKSALYYLNKFNFSIIPVSSDKKALVKWEEFRSRRATAKEVMEWWLKYPSANVGIVTGKLSGIVVVDVDDPSSSSILSTYIPEHLLIPTCSTPRGGYHLYFSYPSDEDIGNAVGILPKIDIRGEGGYVVAPPSTNGNGKKYAWMEDRHIVKVDPPEIPEALVRKCNQTSICSGMENALSFNINNLNTIKIAKTVPDSGSVAGDYIEEGQRNDTLFHVANTMARGGETRENVYNLLRLLAKTCIPPYPEKELPTIVESAFQRGERRKINFKEEVLAFVRVTDGDFSVTECEQAVTGVTARDKRDKRDSNAVRQALKRLKEAGIIEKAGKRDGVYRLIDTEKKPIDILESADLEYPIEYPFGIENMFITMPKNIVIVAGEKDSGKTAFLLNMAYLNAESGNVTYFSSEMGAMELRSRVKKFYDNGEINKDLWSKVKFYEKSSGFDSAIDPNGINIIDFLEIHDEFYKVGAIIRDIYDKLDKGIAIIAIQKNKGTDLGLGGERSREKARLYVTIERRPEGGQRATIRTAKNWRTELNPNGLCMDFKLVKGCLLKPDGAWKMPYNTF